MANTDDVIVLKLRFDDEKIQKFFREFSDKDIPIHPLIAKKSKEKVQKDTAEPIAKGMEEGAKKGAQKVSQHSKNAFNQAKGDAKNFSENLASLITSPLDSMVGNLGGLKGALAATGVGAIAFSLGDAFFKATMELMKFRAQLREDFYLENIEALESRINGISVATGVASGDIARLAADLSKAGVAGGDASTIMGYLKVVLDKVGGSPAQMSEMTNMLKMVTMEGKLSTEQYRTLAKVLGDDVAGAVKSLQDAGRLTDNAFIKETLKSSKEAINAVSTWDKVTNSIGSGFKSLIKIASPTWGALIDGLDGTAASLNKLPSDFDKVIQRAQYLDSLLS